ncbi:HigA family addiction module antitoxin [Pseudoduganella sp. GCM10020061]|uniref:HigA family addiction module antitoxin n=1 Tax=Pseudoduganella sp. GCM10020061 TaxID=3317345 RepID=UPI0036305719
MKIPTPPTVGDIIRQRFMGELNLTALECSRRLGMDEAGFAELLRGEGYITAHMAAILSSQLGLAPDDWLRTEKIRIAWEDLTEPPRHPGAYLREQVLEASGMTVDQLAETLGMPADAVRAIVEEKAPFTADLAWRLSLALGDTPQAWMAMQALYELILARTTFDPETVSKIVFPEEDYTEDAA